MCDVNDGRGGGKATMVEWYPHLPVTILTCNLTLEDFKTPEKTAQCITRQTTSDTPLLLPLVRLKGFYHRCVNCSGEKGYILSARENREIVYAYLGREESHLKKRCFSTNGLFVI